MRCEQLGMAADPDGKRTLCLRAAGAPAQRAARSQAGGSFEPVLIACGALLAVRLARAPSTVSKSRRAQSLARATPRSLLPNRELAVCAAPALAPSRVDDLVENGANFPHKAVIATVSVFSPAPVPAASAERAPSVRAASKRELNAELRATSVAMFSTSACRHGERARRFFRAHELSVVADAQAAAALVPRSGRRSVRLIDVDERVLQGFDERAPTDAWLRVSSAVSA